MMRALAFFLALLIVLRGVFRPTWTRVWLAAVFAVSLLPTTVMTFGMARRDGAKR